MNFKRFKKSITSLLASGVCLLCSQGNSFAAYPQEYKWKELINKDEQAAEAIENSGYYLKLAIDNSHNSKYLNNVLIEQLVYEDVEILTEAISKMYHRAMFPTDCEAVAKFKLISPLLYMIFGSDMSEFEELIEFSHKHKINERDVMKIIVHRIRNSKELKCSPLLKELVCGICDIKIADVALTPDMFLKYDPL